MKRRTAVAVATIFCFLMRDVNSFAPHSNPWRGRPKRTVSNDYIHERKGHPTPFSSSSTWKLFASLTPSTPNEESNSNEKKKKQELDEKEERRQDDNLLRRLAEWSLQDYEWRSSVFKSNEANRKVEESIARLQGIEPSYVRPMDASPSKMGPLGKMEKSAVHWLTAVMEEEEQRAQTIVNKNGKLVRPIDMTRGRSSSSSSSSSNNDNDNYIGPLALLEKAASDFLASIRTSETERVRTKTLRPKDLQADKRGPLGTLELSITDFFDELRASERLRAEFSRSRGGETVRPIDVPGPLGEWELLVADILKAEERRAMELNRNEGKVVRPKDAQYRGPLGQIEQSAVEFLDQLSMEERQRLRSIGERLRENRPMESNRDSLLGILEAILVGIVRAPQMLWSTVMRVQELLSSEMPSVQDQKILAEKAQQQQQQQQQIKPSSSSSGSGSSSSSDQDTPPPLAP